MILIRQIRERMLPHRATIADGAAILVLWLFIFLFVPTLASRPTVLVSDTPVFYSVFHQLSHGSRLYTDVFDHKDPVFYYPYTLFYLVYGSRGPMVWETLLSLGDALLIVRIMRGTGIPFIGRFIVAMVFTGLTFLPAVYYPIHTYQQTIFLFLLSLLLVLGDGKHRPFLAGACGVLMTFSRVTAGVFVPLLFCIALLQPPARRMKSVSGYVAGFASASLLLFISMIVRGEMSGYLDAIRLNLGYPGAVERSEQGVVIIPSAWAHVNELFPHPVILMGLFLFSANLLVLAKAIKEHSHSTTPPPADAAAQPARPGLVAAILGPDSQEKRSDAFYSFVAIYLAVTIALILFVAPFWDHYYQIVGLGISFSLIPVLIATKSLRFHFIPASDVIALIVMGVFVSSGLFHTFLPTDIELTNIPPTTDAIRQDILEHLRQRYGARELSFAVLEENRNAWILAAMPPTMQFRCRLFFQYPFFPADLLLKFRDCLERSGVDIILQDAYPVKMGPDFNQSVTKLLAARYVWTAKLGPFRIWEKQ